MLTEVVYEYLSNVEPLTVLASIVTFSYGCIRKPWSYLSMWYKTIKMKNFQENTIIISNHELNISCLVQNFSPYFDSVSIDS